MANDPDFAHEIRAHLGGAVGALESALRHLQGLKRQRLLNAQGLLENSQLLVKAHEAFWRCCEVKDHILEIRLRPPFTPDGPDIAPENEENINNE